MFVKCTHKLHLFDNKNKNKKQKETEDLQIL
jgi:hypothetical protein